MLRRWERISDEVSGKTMVAIWQHGVWENKSTSKGEKIPRTDLKGA